MKKFISIVILILILCAIYAYSRSTKEINLLNSLPNFPTSQKLKEITGYNNEIDYKEEYVKERGITTNFVISYYPKDVNHLLPIDDILVTSKFNITSLENKDSKVDTISVSSQIIDKWTIKTIKYDVECMLYVAEDQLTATVAMQTYTNDLLIYGITNFDATTLKQNWIEIISPIIERFFNSIY